MRENGQKTSLLKRGSRLVNLLGMAFALGIAFSSVFFVQAKLGREAEDILGGSGMIVIPVQNYEIETQGVGAEETEAAKKLLTAEELVQVVNRLNSETAVAYAHEPLPGQLSIQQALECGSAWMEDIFLPHLSMKEILSSEYKTSCHLWAMQEGGEAEEDQNLLFSYWTVTFNSGDVAASLTLNAVTGQVVDAHVSCFFPIEYFLVEYLEEGTLIPLLEDYTDSFGLEGGGYSSLIVGKDGKFEEEKWGMYEFLEGGELFSVVQAASYDLASAVDDSTIVEQNIFSIHLYVGPQIEPMD